MFNFVSLCELLSKDIKEIIEWCQQKHLIANNRKCVCDNQMNINYKSDKELAFWRCRKSIPFPHDISKSVFENTFFSNRNFGLKSQLILMYKFSIGETKYSTIKRETSKLSITTSDKTICKLLSKCRETCFIWLNEIYTNKGLIGGNKVVEIDETKIGKRKYNRGRKVDGHWLLGMIEIENGVRKGGRFRVAICPNNKRDAQTLVTLIKENVAPNTTIVTDLWRCYNGLKSEGYHHLTVNHSLNFVDPITFANTQTIESNWRPLKKRICCGGITGNTLADHLSEYLWRRDMIQKNKDLFLGLLETVAQVYKTNS